MFLTYDPLEDRHVDGVNHYYKHFPLVFSMGRRFQNYNNIFIDWAMENVEKSLVEPVKRYERQE